MCDFFWLSPADQAGDLSDVVRASLQQQPPPLPHHHRLPAATSAAPAVCSLGSHHLPEEDGLLLLQAGRVNFDGDDHDEERSQRQLVNGNGSMGLMLGSSNSSGGCACDHAAALCPQHHPEAEGLIPQPPMSGPQPQSLCASSFVGRDDDSPVLEIEEHVLGMAMVSHHPHTSAVKRRKSQTKKVVCIPAPVAAPPGVAGRPSTSGEVVPSDLWAWRKYGQKPIKGSPYPRGYYRCSSSKGCSARKQVERSRTDPSMLVITYTSDHNHPWPTQRNALAGSTRPAFSSSSSSARSHHHHHNHHRHHSAAAVPDTTPAHRHASNVAVADNATPGPGSIISASSIHHQLLKQEVVDMDNNASSKQPAQDAADDHDRGMFQDMDGALDVLCASDDFHQKRQQQQATAQHLEKLPEEEDKQLLPLGPDPFSFSFLDWVGASFGFEETAGDNGDHS